MAELRQLQEQLIELQTQLAFQEDAVHALDQIVIAQQQRLDQLEQANTRLERQITELMAWLESQREADIPPHY